jgi:Gpi18-like mannosyltransferase
MKSLQSTLRSFIPDKEVFLSVILLPFLATRVIWIIVGYFVTNNLLPNPTYLKYAERGFFLTRFFPVDIFARWDSAAYFSIIKNGYQPSSDITSVYSNIPFFPLYPYLVKGIGWLGVPLPDGVYVLSGVLLSNLLFLGAIIVLYRLILEWGYPNKTAERTIGLIYVFPTSFFYASFYTESLFFFLSVLGFLCILKEKWGVAAIISALALLTRTQGVILWFVLFGAFTFSNRSTLLSKPRQLFYFLIAPLGLILHFGYLYNLTGYPFAPFAAMTAWGRNDSNFFTNIQDNLNGPGLDVFKIDLILTLVFIVCSVIVLVKWQNKSPGFYALTLSSMPIASGLLVSVSRYLLPVFPVFILWASLLKRDILYDLLRLFLFSFQIIYFAGWVNYFWIA